MQAQIEILEVLVLTFPYSIVNVLHAAPVSLPFLGRVSPGARPVQPAARADAYRIIGSGRTYDSLVALRLFAGSLPR